MSKKHDKYIERQLIDVVNSRVNDNKCGECDNSYPTWASWNLGILLCGRCASLHRRILAHDGISKVKSLTLDHWTTDQVENMRRIGNKRAKKRWNSKRVPFPYDDDDDGPIEQFLREKYILRKFTDDRSFDDDGFSRHSDDSPGLAPRLRLNSVKPSRLRLNSVRQIPRLSHRTLTPSEQSQYQFQVRKIMGLGYTNRDAVLESLILTDGSIDRALDVLDQDSKSNPLQNELPPLLPKRPSAASSSNLSVPPATTASSAPSEWWNNADATASTSSTQLAQPQIYQYTDPVTGQVSYVDANGQQYLDPNNPDHQRMLMQQTNPQLVAQQTNKQNIMSLYGQPENFTTNVVSKVDAGQAPQTPSPYGQPGQVQMTQGGQMQPQMTQLNQMQPQVAQMNQMQPQVTQFAPQGQLQPGQFQQQQFQPQFTGFGSASVSPYGQQQQQGYFPQQFQNQQFYGHH